MLNLPRCSPDLSERTIPKTAALVHCETVTLDLNHGIFAKEIAVRRITNDQAYSCLL